MKLPPFISQNLSRHGCRVTHRERGEGQADASKAVQGESQEDEC